MHRFLFFYLYGEQGVLSLPFRAPEVYSFRLKT